MRKINKFAVISMLLLGLLPASNAFAHDNGNEDNDHNDRGQIRAEFNSEKHRNEHKRNFNGTVTAKGINSFTFTAANGTVYTANVGVDTKLKNPFGTTILLTAINVNDKVEVKGTLSGTTITASSVIDMPANTHKASGKGTITAVGTNTLTLQMNSHGIISNVPVNTNTNTTVTKADGSTGALTDVTVGSKVKVRGLWDEILNVLKAITIRIK